MGADEVFGDAGSATVRSGPDLAAERYRAVLAEVEVIGRSLARLEADVAVARDEQGRALTRLEAARRAWVRAVDLEEAERTVAAVVDPGHGTEPQPTDQHAGRPPGQGDRPRTGGRPLPVALALLGVGAVLLLSAAAVFVTLSWRDLGILGQSVVLGVVTGTAGLVTGLLRRRGLPAATEALAGVTAGLLVLDLIGARAFDLAGLRDVAVDLYTTVAAAGLCALAVLVTGLTSTDAALRHRGRIRAAPIVAVGGLLVGAMAALSWIATATAAASTPVDVSPGGSTSDLFAVVVGPLDAVLVVGACCLRLAPLLRRVPGAAAVAVTARVSGYVVLYGGGVLALLVPPPSSSGSRTTSPVTSRAWRGWPLPASSASFWPCGALPPRCSPSG